MSLNSALYGLVTGDAGVSALISTRFYPAAGVQGGTKPFAVYQQISGPREYSQSGAGGLTSPRYQLTAVADTFDAAMAVADALRALLSGYKGTTGGVVFRAVFLENEAAGYHDGLNEFTVRQDYRIWHTE